MNSKLCSLCYAGLALLISGCVSFNSLPQDDSADWAFQGKMAIKNATEASSFNVTWQQLDDAFDIELSGPLGQGRTTVHGDNTQVTLTQGKDQWTAHTLEDLLWDLQQMKLPLDYLQYWVRALPKPSEPFNQTIDPTTQQVLQLNQAGWQVEFSSYHDTTPAMPRKLSFTRNDNSGKLVIREWSLLQLP